MSLIGRNILIVISDFINSFYESGPLLRLFSCSGGFFVVKRWVSAGAETGWLGVVMWMGFVWSVGDIGCGVGDFGCGAGDFMGCVGVFVMVDGDCSCWMVCVLFPFPIV